MDEIYRQLSEIFSEVFFRDDLTLNPELTAADVDGWNSFKQVEIILAVEEKFNIHLHSKEIDSLLKVGDLAETIYKKLS